MREIQPTYLFYESIGLLLRVEDTDFTGKAGTLVEAFDTDRRCWYPAGGIDFWHEAQSLTPQEAQKALGDFDVFAPCKRFSFFKFENKVVRYPCQGALMTSPSYFEKLSCIWMPHEEIEIEDLQALSEVEAQHMVGQGDLFSPTVTVEQIKKHGAANLTHHYFLTPDGNVGRYTQINDKVATRRHRFWPAMRKWVMQEFPLDTAEPISAAQAAQVVGWENLEAPPMSRGCAEGLTVRMWTR